ncbi:MAG: ankyrin repeat domain-containing protein [Spirochaetes bacterium]|nr:ankyrin repeat domain-containing protein [Spirochaetota bacterium]
MWKKNIIVLHLMLVLNIFTFASLNDDLLSYIKDNDLQNVKKCIENGADINYSDYLLEGMSPLIASSMQGYMI